MKARAAGGNAGSWFRDICVLTAAYSAALLYLAGFPHCRMAFPLDDSWIHQVVARNLAWGGTLGYVPGVPSSGSSSLLWSLVLAANWKFCPAISPVFYAGILNGVLLVCCGIGLLAMARRDGMSASSCWIWALGPALNGNFIWLGLTGMEHVLFSALSIAAIYLWFQESRRSALLASLCMGALCLTRPEGLVLAALLVLTFRWAHRSLRDRILLLSVTSLCVAISLAANRITSQSWLPMTYAGRKWLYFSTQHPAPSVHLLFVLMLPVDILRAWAAQPAQRLLLLPVVLLLIALGIAMLLRRHLRRCTALCLWSATLIAVYAVMLPTGAHADRYLPLFLALSFPLMFLGAEVVLRSASRVIRSPRVRSGLQTAAALLTVLLCGLPSLRLWREITRDGEAVVESTHARMGAFLNVALRSGGSIAAFDIGRMGYIYAGRLNDLGGLTDSSFLPYMQEGGVSSYLANKHIRYLIWPSFPDGASELPALLVVTPEMRSHMTQLAIYCAPEDAWNTSFAATGVSSPCQVLYRLDSS